MKESEALKKICPIMSGHINFDKDGNPFKAIATCQCSGCMMWVTVYEPNEVTGNTGEMEGHCSYTRYFRCS